MRHRHGLRKLNRTSSHRQAMALVYTALGIAAALIGEGLAAYLQNPVVLISFGVLLLLLSLSMFGVYELQLPSFLRDRLETVNAGLTGGQLGGVFAMGVLSALIVSPCVTGPLSGLLLFIASTHNVALGGATLLLIAIGMSAPLLVAGASAGELLPRAGAWMERVKQVFGLMLVGVAFYIMCEIPMSLSIGWRQMKPSPTRSSAALRYKLSTQTAATRTKPSRSWQWWMLRRDGE